MLTHLLRPLRRRFDFWKRATDRRYRGIWLGPAPKLLREADLLPGDVLFCAGNPKLKRSRLIAEATDGQYVHCALYLGSGLVIDVVPAGVRSITLTQLTHDYAYLVATRCPGNEQDLRRRRQVIAYGLRALRGGIRGYDRLGAALVPLRELALLRALGQWSPRRSRPAARRLAKRMGKAHMFCSEFVANAYVACGYMPAYTWPPPHRLSPNGLAEANIFTFLGYMSATGWGSVHRDDHYLAGNAWVLTEAGRAHLQQRERQMLEEDRGTRDELDQVTRCSQSSLAPPPSSQHCR